MTIKMKISDDSPENKRRLVAASGGIAVNATSPTERHYAASALANVPITKNAQYAGSGANVAWTQPMFFSPIHTPQQWQIASRQREVRQWARFYYQNEPKVAAGVDFYSNFSMNGFKLECKSKKILRYYERMVEKLDLVEKLNSISHEYFLMGDVFPFLEIECPSCHNRGVNSEGKPCKHPDGTFKSIKVMNPDYIEVKDAPIASNPEYYLIPDEDLKLLVTRREPRKIYESLPQTLINLIAAGQPIPLSDKCISHLKHNASDYGTYGISMLQRLFTVLAYKTKIMTANWIIAERLILPIRVVKIGDKDRPATETDLQDVVTQLAAVANDPNLTIVTHHNFDYEWYGASGKIHNITQELELIGKEILDGLMLNQAILNGEMAGYTSAQVGIEVLIRRLDNWRNKLKNWVEKNIFLPVAMMQGFIDEEESKQAGYAVHLYPKFIWNDLQLRDKTNRIQTLMQMYDKGLVSAQTMLDEVDLDYDSEVEKIREEQVMAGPMGQMGGPQGANLGTMGMGAPPGGGMPPDIGGEGIGGAPGMGAPAGGGPGMGAPAGGAGMGGAPGGGMGAAAESNALPKIGKRGSKSAQEQQAEEQPVMQPIKLTKLESKMYKTLLSMKIPHELYGQYSVNVPGEQRPFSLDFAYPKIGVGIECLHPDTYVPTTDGSIMAKDINENQKLIGRNGEPVKIVKKYINKSKGSLLNIKAMGMDKIRVTDNHPFLVCKPKKIRVKRKEANITRTRKYYIPDEPEFINANQVKKGDYLVVPKNRQISNNYKIEEELDLSDYRGNSYNAHEIPHRVKLDEEFGWLMGMYAAEGCSTGLKNRVVEFSFHIDEIEYSDRVQYLLDKIFNLPSSVTVYTKNNCRKVICCCTSLGKFLLDSFGHKAIDKKMPVWMFESPIECKEAYLEAFCQGDGCMRKDGAMRYISSSKKMMIDTQALAFSTGRFAPLCQSRKSNKKICFAGRTKESIVSGLWEMTTKEENKNKIYREDDDYYYVPITSITREVYDGDVINFETNGEGKNDHTYLVCNVITHNCDGAIWHQREDFQQRDMVRDQKLANVGWRVLRFKENAIEEHMDTVRDIIYKNIVDASKAHKKTAENENIMKYASNDGNRNPVYEYMIANKEKLGCYRENISDDIQILYIGIVENGE